MTKPDVKLRLAYGSHILQLLDSRRAQSGNAAVGAAIEKRLIDRELAELEKSALMPRTILTISPLAIARLAG